MDPARLTTEATYAWIPPSDDGGHVCMDPPRLTTEATYASIPPV